MRKRVRRALVVVTRVLAALVAGVAIVAAFGFWRLSQGPISLDPIAPYIASALSRGSDITTTIDHTLVSLTRDGHIAILARGVHLSRPGGAVLTLKEMSLEFSFKAALAGVIAPTRIAVIQPELRLVRDTDGSFHLGIGDLETQAAESWGGRLIGDLLHPPRGTGPLGSLTSVSIEQASLVVDDRSLGLTWRADAVDLSLERAADRTGGTFSIAAGGATFRGDYIYTVADDTLVMRFNFAHITPAHWAAAAPSLAGLAALDVAFSGQMIAVIDGAKLALRYATWDVTLGPGEIRHPAFAGGALALAGARMQGGYDPAHQRVNIGLLTAELPHGAFAVSGSIDGIGAEILSGARPTALDVNAEVAAQGLAIDDLPRLWPEYAAADTRDWVTQHLHDGTIDRFQAQLAMHVDLTPGAAQPVEIRRFDGTMAYRGLSVEYFRPLPPVRDVAGTARFDRTEITFTATGGTLNGIKVSGATARFYKLDTDDQQAAIEVSGAGPLADALAVLDTPPLRYARGMGIDSKRTRGSFSAQAHFAFPLMRDLPLSDVDYNATAALTNVAIPGVVLGRDLGSGELALKLDRKAAQATGTATLAGVPVNLTWRQDLQPHAPVRTRYGIVATLDDAQRDALGLGLFDAYATGPIGIDANYGIDAQKRGEATVILDFTKAKLALPALGWSKPPGVAASGRVTLDLAGDAITGLRQASLSGGGMDAALSARFGATGLSGVTIDRLVTGKTDLHGAVAIDDRGRWTIDAEGKSFDAAALMKEFDQSSGVAPPFILTAKIARFILGPGREANDLSVRLVSDGPHWQEAAVDGRFDANTGFNLRFGAPAGGTGAGARSFKLTTDNFGALLKLTDVYDQVQGGSFTLTGTAEDRNGQRVLVADAQGSDYRVVNAPALARLLSLASLSGVGALLSGEGIPFSQLRGQAIFSTSLISLINMRAYGGALGINASGNVDRISGQMDVAGTLVPAYTLNSVLGNIPVLGELLVGGQGQGIFAANFRIYGPRENPHVSLNPLSTLAPGVLRNLFLFAPPGP